MSKRDEIADIIRAMEDSEQTWGECADAILALLSAPDDRMVDAAIYAYMAVNGELRDAIKAAIRAAMQAAGE